MRLNPLNRIDTVLAQFRGLEGSEDLAYAWDLLDKQKSEAGDWQGRASESQASRVTKCKIYIARLTGIWVA